MPNVTTLPRFSSGGKADESANEAEPGPFSKGFLLPTYQRGNLEVANCYLKFVGRPSILA
jgi:hypothetical protein